MGSPKRLVKLKQTGSRARLLKDLEINIRDYHQRHVSFCMFLFRLDNFSKIDKNRGALGTQCVIKELKARLTDSIAYQGCLYQLNADRIALVISDHRHGFDEGYLKQLDKVLRQPVNFYYDIITVELSMSLVEMAAEFSTASDLLHYSEHNLENCNRQQRHWRSLSCQQCHNSNNLDRKLFKELKQGLADVELHLAGQPIYNFDNGELTIVEVLLRWHHVDHGAINPIKIIELAGKNGYLYSVAVYVCQQLASFLVENIAKYQNVSFAINFNMPQIINKRLIEHVFAIFDHHGIDRSKLIFESTETDALPISFEDAAGHFHWIRQQGVQVAMDDFGAGYSTLALLSSIDVDLVKIDRSLVQDIELNPRRLETLLSILALCQRLRLNIVIEGIENEQQHQLLVDSDIRNLLVQGYFYGKPIALQQHQFNQVNGFIFSQQQNVESIC